ncbi:MAG: metal-dependent transcriptional regulator [Methanomicrobiales archaeon HGW-Methanomicrobiales-1]|jgi:DtxR family Mn-dependent transcriptional regulator|nr:MAG: metal-dependent transcriptional regulator [Methanomicrobiales archaeon HGW-Methanomicrobiales-1]
MAQEQIEEYLETIYDLESRDGSAKTTAIAKCLKVAPASVTEVLRSLSDKGLVSYEPYKGATLTEEGKKIADTIKRKHRLLEVFLTNVLHLNREKVHDEACRMEHTISEETENGLCRMLDAPSHCPHGSPISPCNKCVGSCAECDGAGKTDAIIASRNKKIIPITDLNPDQEGRIAFIRGDCKVVQRLSDLGLTLGTRVAILKKTPMDGPVEISVRRTKLAVDHAIAGNIFIELPDAGEL